MQNEKEKKFYPLLVCPYTALFTRGLKYKRVKTDDDRPVLALNRRAAESIFVRRYKNEILRGCRVTAEESREDNDHWTSD